MPLIPALGRERQVDLCEFEASLIYRVSSRTARTVTQRKTRKKCDNWSVQYFRYQMPTATSTAQQLVF